MIRLPVYEWEIATQHLADVRAEIEAARHDSALGAENTLFVMIRPLEERYRKGERTPELYKAMMTTTFRTGKSG